MKLTKVLVALAASGCFAASANVKMPSLFSDNMILQRDCKVNVWGWADEGENVTVTFKGQTQSAVAKNGQWMVSLNPMGADKKGAELTVAGKNKLSFKNVVVGDIWICSGQSNMEWPTHRANNGAAEVKNANYPDIRIFQGNIYRGDVVPQNNIPGRSWKVCSPGTIGNFSAVGYFFARDILKTLNVPVGLIGVYWGGTRIEPWTAPQGFAARSSLRSINNQVAGNIAGTPAIKKNYEQMVAQMEAWKAAAKKNIESGKTLPPLPRNFINLIYIDQRSPVVLFNTMIHPLKNLAFKGALWYQGCSNAGEGMLYADKMHALVSSWRKFFNMPQMPFYFVQLAPFNYRNPYVLPNLWVAQQAFADEDKYSAMALTNDIGNFRDIHPTNKQDVGKRLALLALKYTYGKKELVADSPFYASHKIDGNKFIVTFRNAVKLSSKDGKPVRHFEIAGKNGVYYPAAVKLEGNKAILTSDKVAKPYMARFAWNHNVNVNLVNENKLPAGAFQATTAVPVREDLDRLIPEAKNMKVAYAFSCKRPAQGGKPLYTADNSKQLAGKKITKIGYFMRLAKANDEKYVFVTVDPFTQDVNKLGLPVAANKIFFQQKIKNMTVKSNVTGVANGTFPEGNVEIWPSNYGTYNTIKIANADDRNYDFGDGDANANQNGYGSFQLHNFAQKQVVFALNGFHNPIPDAGIGNNAKGNKDYTFAKNAGAYQNADMVVLVSVE